MSCRSCIFAVALLGCSVQVAAATCDDVSSAAPPPVPAQIAGEEAYEALRGFDRTLRLGVGHLRPARAEDRPGWLERVLIPLAARPGGPVALWLFGGWVVPAAGGAPRRVGMRGALETGYESVSLIVLGMDEAGWLRIRFAPGDESSSTGWLHLCDLENIRPQVVYEPWEHFFGRRAIAPLYFRTGGPRALRRAPEAGAEALAWIPAEGRKYALEPLEFSGDWLRARLTAPSDHCRVPDVKPTVREGWVRWRDPRLGPLVWYYTRGC